MTRGCPKIPGRQRRPNSFTLVELLVALALLSVISLILLSMLGSIATAWELGQAQNERRSTAQAVFQRMSRDLRQIAAPSSRYNTNSLEFIINPGAVSATYRFPQAVFWQAPVATDGASSSASGDLAIVGYFVQWVGAAPCLSRILINPSSASYSIYATPANWMSDTLIASNAPATASASYQGLLAENVLGLWVQALDGQGNPIQQANSTVNGEAFDSRYAYAYTNYLYTNGGSPVLATNAAPALPCALQIGIVVIDSRTADRLAGTEKPTTLTGNFWGDINSFYTNLPAVIRKGAEIQTTTVSIANGPR